MSRKVIEVDPKYRAGREAVRGEGRTRRTRSTGGLKISAQLVRKIEAHVMVGEGWGLMICCSRTGGGATVAASAGRCCPDPADPRAHRAEREGPAVSTRRRSSALHGRQMPVRALPRQPSRSTAPAASGGRRPAASDAAIRVRRAHLPRTGSGPQRVETSVRGSRAEVTGHAVHDLRHAHASWLLAGGADLQVVKERLGHATIIDHRRSTCTRSPTPTRPHSTPS